MKEEQIISLVEKQREYFYTGKTLNVDLRLAALRRLRAGIVAHEKDIYAAIREDLGKSDFESCMCEYSMTLSELDYMLKNTPKFAREKTVPTPLAQFASRSYVKPSPYGVVLIMSPWNYPFMLTMDPLIDALAAGNTAILKPSAYSPATSRIIEIIIRECFPSKYVAVITGGRAENACLLQQHFDYIFFTGSKAVGQTVMEQASKHLTPVTLELGGKSPCIVDRTADLKVAARRIVFGKYLNCGQTCVAPDYILCEESVKDELIADVVREILRQFGRDPLANDDYGKIINEKHFKRILGLIDPDKVVYGGDYDADTLQIEPTVMDNVSFSDAVMGEEIFGPIMPVLTFTSMDDVIQKINSMPHPLALYLFTTDEAAKNEVMSRVGFGGGCINDTIIHLATSHMPFGGFGESGMGGYHGKAGFDTFSHYKSIVDKKVHPDLPVRYQPYSKTKKALLDKFV